MTENKKILIVEDEVVSINLLSDMIIKLGFTVAGIAVSGAEAVLKSEMLTPDLVLMDIKLSGDMDGIEAAAHIKKNFGIPIIFITGQSDEESILRAQEFEPYGYLIKPIDIPILKLTVITALRQHGAEIALRESEAVLRIMADNYPNSYVSIIEKDLTIGFTSGREFRRLNLDPRKFEGLTLEQVFAEHHLIVKEHYLKTFAGEEQTFELFINFQYQLYRTVPLRASDGSIPRILSVVENITGRRRIEQELEHYRNHLEDLVQQRTRDLRESEEKFQAIADYTYDWESWLDQNGKPVWVSPSVINTTGYSVEECLVMQDYPLPIIFEEDRLRIKKIIDENILKKTSGNNLEFRINQKNNKCRWVSMSWGSIYNNTGKNTGIRFSMHDITDRKKAEDEILRLNRNIIKLQEEERQKVSKDLHDSVGQTILAAKLNLETYRKDPGQFGDRLNIGISFIEIASQELRAIYMNLYPTILSDLGLESAVGWLAKNMMESNGVAVQINIDLSDVIYHDLEVALYRIIQELFSNILKHSHADTVELDLSSHNQSIELVVKDNGIGFKEKEKIPDEPSYGVSNIQTRVNSFNGKIIIEENKPAGASISITIPLEKQNE